MRVESSKDNIIFLKADTQYELASTFLRMQEYYESPKFQGQYIDLEEYMDWYAQEYGNFTYTSDWNGFNVPGNIVRKFYKEHTPLMRKEKAMYDLIKDWVEGDEDFYVIGIWKADNTLDHEFSHAFFYLNTSYKAQQKVALRNLPTEFRERCDANLKEKGYHPSVFEDESIAYLSTNTMADTDDQFKENIPWNEILPLQINFNKCYETYKEEKK